MVAACCLQVRNAAVVTGEILPWSRSAGSSHNHHRSWQHCGSMLFLVWALSSFGALMLSGGREEGHLACKSCATTVPKSLLLGTGLTCSNQTWNNCEKWASYLNNNHVRCTCVHVSLYCLSNSVKMSSNENADRAYMVGNNIFTFFHRHPAVIFHCHLFLYRYQEDRQERVWRTQWDILWTPASDMSPAVFNDCTKRQRDWLL